MQIGTMPIAQKSYYLRVRAHARTHIQQKDRHMHARMRSLSYILYIYICMHIHK